jgi:hypothetical protein
MKMIYGFFPLTLEPKTFVWLENYPNTPPLPWWERAGVRGSIRLGYFHGLRLPAVGRGPRSFDKLRRRPRLHAQAPQCAGTEGRPYPIECRRIHLRVWFPWRLDLSSPIFGFDESNPYIIFKKKAVRKGPPFCLHFS